MIPLTQINISKSKIRMSRLFFNSTRSLFLQLKAATHFLKILISYPDQMNKRSFSIFNIFLNFNQYLTFFLLICLHPSPWTWHVLFIISLFFLSKRKGGCFCKQCKSNFLVIQLWSISPGRLNILHLWVVQHLPIRMRWVGNLQSSKHPEQEHGLMPQSRLLGSQPLLTVSSVFLPQV